jgi:hypothetical protein
MDISGTYALLRWGSNSATAAAIMHAFYNGVIAITMFHADQVHITT